MPWFDGLLPIGMTMEVLLLVMMTEITTDVSIDTPYVWLALRESQSFIPLPPSCFHGWANTD